MPHIWKFSSNIGQFSLCFLLVIAIELNILVFTHSCAEAQNPQRTVELGTISIKGKGAVAFLTQEKKNYLLSVRTRYAEPDPIISAGVVNGFKPIQDPVLANTPLTLESWLLCKNGTIAKSEQYKEAPTICMSFSCDLIMMTKFNNDIPLSDCYTFAIKIADEFHFLPFPKVLR